MPGCPSCRGDQRYSCTSEKFDDSLGMPPDYDFEFATHECRTCQKVIAGKGACFCEFCNRAVCSACCARLKMQMYNGVFLCRECTDFVSKFMRSDNHLNSTVE
jgi:hypothetical protein